MTIGSSINLIYPSKYIFGGEVLKNLINPLNNKFNYNAPIEVVIKKIYKLKGPEIEEINNSELIISEEDSSLIEVDIIIDIPANL
jgi:hypothetical protein